MDNNKYTQVWLTKTRWVNMDRFGNKDKITISTSKGQLLTRTVQFWQMVNYKPHARITVNQKPYMVTPDTILEL
jgi:hypothetical protein